MIFRATNLSRDKLQIIRNAEPQLGANTRQAGAWRSQSANLKLSRLKLVAIFRAFLLIILCVLSNPAFAVDAKTDNAWWEKRNQKSDVYYPHNAHLEVMKEEGDSCLLCHSYAKTDIADIKKLKNLTVIANEPLKAVCHSCHVDEQRAPWRCDVCHADKERIQPPDHRFDYKNHHNEAARGNEKTCQACHLDVNFCTDCHLRRDTSGAGYHPLAYRTLHGLEARFDSARCGRCHNENYCSDCHATR